MKNGTTNEKTLGKCKKSSQHHRNSVPNADKVRNIYKRVALFPSRAKPGLTRSLGNQKRQKSKTNRQKTKKVTTKMHLGKHANFNDFSDGNKNWKNPEKSGFGVKKDRMFMIFHAFCRPKTMQKHAPLKLLKLKEASSDMIVAPFPSFSKAFLSNVGCGFSDF